MMRPLIPAVIISALGLLPAPWLSADEETATTPTQDERPGQEQRPYLGITVDRNATAFAGKVTVGRVFPGSTASKLGLQSGDVLSSVNDQAISDQESLNQVIQGLPIGEEVQLVWQRDDEEMRGRAAMEGLPLQRAQAQQLSGLQQDIRRLEAERQALTEAQSEADEEAEAKADMQRSLQELAVVLNALPHKLEAVSAQFKELYPDGSFTINLEIDIRTHAKDSSAIDVGPGNIKGDQRADDKKADDKKADDKADSDKPAEKRPDEDSEDPADSDDD